jgi:mannose-6-phosphate isomerase-like protein (cupin superfamily)
MEKNTIVSTRRRAIQQFGLLATAFTFPSLALLTTVEANNNKIDNHTPEPFALMPRELLQPGPGGLNIRTWVRSKQTNMQYSSVETAVAPKQMGPAPHLHKELDEIMLVLEGTASVLVGDKLYEIPAGGWQLRPRGIEHTFWNATDKPLRFIDMYFNQNFEDYLEELFHKIIPDMVQKKLSPADPGIVKRMADLNNKFGVTMFPEKRQAIIDRYRLKS